MALILKEVKNIYLGEGKTITLSDMQGPCPDGFHVPLKSEFDDLVSIGNSLGAWNNNNNAKIYLKMPIPGLISCANGTVINRGTGGAYISSTFYSASNCYSFLVGNGKVSTVTSGSNGYNIRPFKDTPVVPDSNWTVLYQGTGDSGIYHNPTLGLISLSSNGTKWITISDKNLGATTVYNDGDTLTESNCGKYYQLGNNYGFPFNGATSTTSTRVNASTYGPGNYYNSSTFFITSDSSILWDSSNNYNLRGGVSQGSSTIVKTGIKEVYIGETKVYPKSRTFTVTWTETSDPTQFNPTYSDDAAGLTAGSTAFDEFFGYYGCRLSNAGAETAKVNQSSPGTLDITQLGTLTSGDNVMIAFPRRGIKMSKSGTQVTLSITEDPNKAGYQYYAHTKGSDAKDTLYIGAYKMVSGYKSLSGVKPLASLTRASFRNGVKSTYDSSAGTDRYSQISIYARWYINALYMMKYGNPYSSNVIGAGYTRGGASTNTGGTNSHTSASYGTSSTITQAKLFGLEDWWGNVYEYLDCCWFNSSTQLTVDKTNSVFQDSDYSTNLGVASSGWLAGIDGSNDGMFKNVNTNGSETTYYTDGSWASPSKVILAGGYWTSNSYAGVFNLDALGSSFGNNYNGARLMYI